MVLVPRLAEFEAELEGPVQNCDLSAKDVALFLLSVHSSLPFTVQMPLKTSQGTVTRMGLESRMSTTGVRGPNLAAECFGQGRTHSFGQESNRAVRLWC